MATHHYTDKTYYEYDATLTQTLLTQYINTLSSSSATKTDMTYLRDMVNMSRFTGSRHEPNPDISSGESEEPRPSTVTHDYRNFIGAAGVNFDQARSAASAAGVDPSRVKNAIRLNDSGLQATNITFAEGGDQYHVRRRRRRRRIRQQYDAFEPDLPRQGRRRRDRRRLRQRRKR